MKICFDYEIFWKQKLSSIGSRYYYNLIKNLTKYKELNLKIFAGFYLDEKISELSKDIVFGKRIRNKIPFTGKLQKSLTLLLLIIKFLSFVLI